MVGTSSDSIELMKKSPGQSSRSSLVLKKSVSTGVKADLTGEGDNRFPATEGEIILTMVFQDNNKMRVLETHRGFQSNVLVNCLVNNIVFPDDDNKLSKMICSELNQFIGAAKFKVYNITFYLSFNTSKHL